MSPAEGPAGARTAGPANLLLEEVRRDSDGELLGYVRSDSTGWRALTIFHAPLGSAADQAGAVRAVRERGLPSLAERWHWFSRADGTWRIVLPQESRPGWVRLWVGYYPGPETPQVTVTADDLAQGDQLTLDPPPGIEIDPGM